MSYGSDLPHGASLTTGSNLIHVSLFEGETVGDVLFGFSAPQDLEDARLNRSSFRFAPTPLGEPSERPVFSLLNLSPRPWTVGRVTFRGDDPSDFRIVNNDCAGTTLDPGRTCSFEVRYQPLSPGEKVAELVVNPGEKSSGPPPAAQLAGSGFGKVTLVHPNGGETFLTYYPQVISWGAPAGVKSFRIFYSEGAGGQWRQLTGNAIGGNRFQWDASGLEGYKFKVRVVGYDERGLEVGEDISDRYFRIRLYDPDPV